MGGQKSNPHLPKAAAVTGNAIIFFEVITDIRNLLFARALIKVFSFLISEVSSLAQCFASSKGSFLTRMRCR
jgi:hypothetical protein